MRRGSEGKRRKRPKLVDPSVLHLARINDGAQTRMGRQVALVRVSGGRNAGEQRHGAVMGLRRAGLKWKTHSIAGGRKRNIGPRFVNQSLSLCHRHHPNSLPYNLRLHCLQLVSSEVGS